MARVSMPTTNTKLSFVLNAFSGGLVNNVNDAKMKDNQSPDMLNMMFRVDGLLQKRPGTVFINETPFVGDLIRVIPYEYEANREVLLFLTSDGLYYKSTANGKYKSVWENNGLDIKYVHFMGTLYFTDGLFLYSYHHNDRKTCKIVNPPSDFTPNPKPAVTGVHKDKLIKTLSSGVNVY